MHFDNLLNKEQVVSGAIPHSLSFEIVFSGLDYPIPVDEIESVMYYLSNQKDAGPDDISMPLSLRIPIASTSCVFFSPCLWIHSICMAEISHPSQL